MGSAFSSLEVARQALVISQNALEVTSQNIANASTPGYTRQRLDITSLGSGTGTDRFLSQQPHVGRGARANKIEQIRDSFLDGRYRTENAIKSQYDELASTLSQIEDIFNEFGGDDEASGLSGQLSTLLSRLRQLQASPDDTNLAAVVKSSMSVICQTVQSNASQLTQLLDEVKGNLAVTVNGGGGEGGINAILTNISDLNRQIANYEVNGQKANELRDQRNNLLDQLSASMAIDVTELDNGMVTVALKNDTAHMLIDSGNAVTYLTLNEDRTRVQWADGTDAAITGGSVGADLEIINGDGTGTGDFGALGIPALKGMLDDFARGFTEAFNNIASQGGASSRPLLQATGAEDFDISDDWKNDDILIVRNYTGADTGNYVARFINLFAQKGVITSQGAAYPGTIQDFTDSISIGVANRLSYINQMASASDNIVQNLDHQRQAISSVSIDEEGINIIRYQQSYNAAARVISAINEMLDTLINSTGR